jgi:hypothetical protein
MVDDFSGTWYLESLARAKEQRGCLWDFYERYHHILRSMCSYRTMNDPSVFDVSYTISVACLLFSKSRIRFVYMSAESGILDHSSPPGVIMPSC